MPKTRPAPGDKIEGRAIRMISLDGIGVANNRLRKLQPDRVDELAESIGKQGLLHPIILRPRAAGGVGYLLVVGQHRLEAVRKLHKAGHWPSGAIRAEIVDEMAEDAAVLAEIDENLIRAELSPAERAMHIARRKEIYERKNPETKHGAVGRGRKKSGQLGHSKERFTKDAAKKTGQSERKIRRDARRGQKLEGKLQDVAGTSLDKGEELDALAELPEAEQDKVIAEAKAGKDVSAKASITRVHQRNKPVDVGFKSAADAGLPQHPHYHIRSLAKWSDEYDHTMLGHEVHKEQWPDLKSDFAKIKRLIANMEACEAAPPSSVH